MGEKIPSQDPTVQESTPGPRVFWKVGFALSGLVPLLGLRDQPPSTMLLFYSLFVVIWFFRKPVQAVFQRFPGGDSVRLLVVFLVSGSICEAIAWSDNYVKAAETPALFHPQLVWDLYLGLGFYAGWAMVWLLAGRYFHFGVSQAFWVTGILGIAFEQVGKILWMMILYLPVNPLFSFVLGMFVLLTHGSIAGLAFLAAGPVGGNKPNPTWWIYPLMCVALVLGAVVGTWMAIAIAQTFGGIPPRESIVDRPIW